MGNKDRLPPDAQEWTLIKSLERDFRPIADKYLGKLADDSIEYIRRREFVRAAHQQLKKHGHRVTLSAIALMTGGINPKFIRREINGSRCNLPLPLAIEKRIIYHWMTDPEFLDPETGLPARLLIYGPGDTFAALVNHIARGVTPKMLLKSLRAEGCVEIVNEHWVRLIKTDGVFSPENS